MTLYKFVFYVCKDIQFFYMFGSMKTCFSSKRIRKVDKTIDSRGVFGLYIGLEMSIGSKEKYKKEDEC